MARLFYLQVTERIRKPEDIKAHIKTKSLYMWIKSRYLAIKYLCIILVFIIVVFLEEFVQNQISMQLFTSKRLFVQTHTCRILQPLFRLTFD